MSVVSSHNVKESRRTERGKLAGGKIEAGRGGTAEGL